MGNVYILMYFHTLNFRNWKIQTNLFHSTIPPTQLDKNVIREIIKRDDDLMH